MEKYSEGREVGARGRQARVEGEASEDKRGGKPDLGTPPPPPPTHTHRVLDQGSLNSFQCC